MQQMRLFVTEVMCGMAGLLLLLHMAPVGAAQHETAANELRYLLTFKALPPHQKHERNLYEFAQAITGFIDGRYFPPSGVLTSEEVRYGVFAMKQTRLLRSTDSQQSPQSRKEGVYVLVYNALYKLCATNYRITRGDARRGTITYVDCEDGKSYDFPVTTRRPFRIYEVEVVTEDILRQMWQEKHQAK